MFKNIYNAVIYTCILFILEHIIYNYIIFFLYREGQIVIFEVQG